MIGSITVVGIRSKKSEPTRRRINCQRRNPRFKPNPLANPYRVATYGSARAATEQFRINVWEQPHSPELRQKLDEIASLLRQGQDVELGCCGSLDCHCFIYANHLQQSVSHDHS
jgi:hypothetical protein